MRIGERSGRMLSGVCLGAFVALGVAAILLPSRAAGDARRAFSRLLPPDAAALQAAAHTLFRPPRGTLFKIDCLTQRSDPDLSAEYDTYAVSSAEAGPVGTFTRFRCWPAPDSVVDVALRLEEGGIKAAAALRPVTISGAAYPALAAALAAAPQLPAHVWAPPIAALFRALSDQEACLAGPADSEPPDPKSAAAALADLERIRPPLLPAAHLPEMQARDLEGRSFSTGTLSGRPILLIAATVKQDMSRRVLEHAARYAREHPARFELVYVLADAPAAIRVFRDRGGQLPGRILPDPSRRLREALRVSVLPTLFAFDDQSRLTGYRRAPWPAFDDLASQLDRVPTTPAAPAPTPSAEPAPSRPKAKPKRTRKTAPPPEPAPEPSPTETASVAPEPPTTASLPTIAPAALLAAWRVLTPTLSATSTMPTAATTPPTTQIRRTITRFTAGTALQRIDVVDSRDDVLETLVRVTVLQRTTTQIDVLISPEAGGIRAFEPLAPAQVEGRDLPHLRPLLTAAMHRNLDTQGPALARLFAALAHVSRPPRDATDLDAAPIAGTGTGPGTAPRRPAWAVAPGTAAPSASPAPSPAASPQMRLTLVSPGLAVGAAWPGVVRGKRVVELEGRAALVVLVERGGEGALAADVRAGIEREAGNVRVVVVESESESEEAVVPVPFLPYAYAVDAKGIVVGRGAVNGAASVRPLVEALITR